MEKTFKLNKGNYSGTVQHLKEYSGIISNKTIYTENYLSEFHYHENPHLSFILEGGNIEQKSSHSQIKKAGEMLFYYSGETHKTTPANSSTKNMNLEIDHDFLKTNLITENELKDVATKNKDNHFFMLKIHSELYLNDSITETAIHDLLFHYIRNSEENFTNIKWCCKLKELLNDQWNENHTLTNLSIELGVHPVTISKYFPKYFGCTLGEYIRKLRIRHSLRLIRENRFSLTEIAFLCGFADQSHFVRTFRLFTGLNPNYFRKM